MFQISTARFLLPALLLCSPLLATHAAVTFSDEESGLSFTVLQTASTVSVTGPSNYAGRVLTIPEEVEYGGIQYSVAEIGSAAFQNNLTLESVFVPGSVKTIGSSAFRGCSSLTDITIEEGLTAIKAYGFRDTGLQSVVLPATMSELGSQTFQSCTSLTAVTMTSSAVKELNGAFWNCSSLKTVSLPASLTTLGYPDFTGCTSLQAVTLEATVVPAPYGNDKFQDVFDGSCSERCVLYVPSESVELYAESWLAGFSSIESIQDAGPEIPEPEENPDHILLGELPDGMTTVRLTLSDGTVLTLPWLKGHNLPMSISLPSGHYLSALETEEDRIVPRTDVDGNYLLSLPAADGPAEYVADIRTDAATEVRLAGSASGMPVIVRRGSDLLLSDVADADFVSLYDLSGRILSTVSVADGCASISLPEASVPYVLRVGTRSFKLIP